MEKGISRHAGALMEEDLFFSRVSYSTHEIHDSVEKETYLFPPDWLS